MTENHPHATPEISLFDRFNRWISESMTLRLIVIGILILVLMIPLEMVHELINERMYRMDEAKHDVAQSWAGEQTLGGPFLAIPYSVFDPESKTTTYGNLHVLPEVLDIKVQVNPEIRKRGIFEVPVYLANHDIAFSFSPEPIVTYANQTIHWSKARLCFGVSDTRGITDELVLTFQDQSLNFEPGLPDNTLFSSGISSPVVLSWNDTTQDVCDGTIQLKLRGSSDIAYIPLGKTTEVNMTSPWPDPSFVGSFIPSERSISNEGFSAEWTVLHFNRNFPQVFRNQESVGESSFGVQLFMPVNHYQKSERSAKYAVMLIALTFLLLFFSQAIHHLRIHPFQYLLVGLALSLFYVLLLSMSEHIGFNTAYLLAAGMVLVLVLLYLKKISRNWKYPLITTGVLAGLYVYIFTLMQLEDYALLIGSIGLFCILATVMWLSTKIDWSGSVDSR